MKLIFVHGSGCFGEMWRYQTLAFPEAEAIDLPGHPQGWPQLSVAGYSEWLHDYIQGRGYSDLVLCGHSLGGGIVLQYALSYPQELAGLILVGTGARLRVHPQYIAELVAASRDASSWAQDMEERYRLVDPAFRRDVIRKRLEVGPAVQIVDMLCCHHFDVMDRLPQIKVPTLVICGSLDDMTPPKYSHYLHDHIAGSRLVQVDGATHHVFMERPQEVNSAIARFLAEI
ncbi:MAG: alpha/beta hydrolase [Chloroflexi bacterium]|nr:alpha/beta hydrolase [Chloroflexota bacterium]